MDPITLIISALVAGATVGLKDTASSAIRDAYRALKELIIKGADDAKETDSAIQKLEIEPLARDDQLETILQNRQINEELLTLSYKLIELINSEKPQADKPSITINNSQGITLGNGNTINQNFELPKD